MEKTIGTRCPSKFLAAMFVALISPACTHIQTNPSREVASVEPGAPARDGAQRGVSYPLPMVQYDLKITRSLAGCPTTPGASPTIAVKVEASEHYVAGERFEVDYEALSSIMKSTGFEITYHESGTIRTINASAQDRTGAVLTNLARIGIAAAGIAAGGPAAIGLANITEMSPGFVAAFSQVAGDPSKATPAASLHCTAAAVAALNAIQASTGTITRLTAEIETLTLEITRLGALAQLEVITEADRTRLSAAVRELLGKEQEVRLVNATVAELQNPLSVTQELSWPDQAGDITAHNQTIHANQQNLDKLWGLLEVRVSNVPDLTSEDQKLVPVACPDPNRPQPAIECLRNITSLNLGLVPAVTQAPIPGNAPTDVSNIVGRTDRRWGQGIFIREPVDARLIVCRAPARPTATGCSDRSAVVLRDELVIAPQLGRLRLLPFRNGPFQDNKLQLSVRSNGFIERFSYGAESAAAGATDSLAGIAERVQAGQEAAETERRSDIIFARDTLTYERNERAAVRTEEVARLTHQVNLLKAQSDTLAAELALSGATATVQYHAEKARIDAEVQLMLSQIARLKAANELAALNAG